MMQIQLNGGKKVYVSEAYAPLKHALTDFVGRENELRMITAAWMGSRHLPSLSPLLVGEPGVGKNRLVYELARQAKLALYIMQGHEDVTAEDLACSVRFSDEKERNMDYVISPLVTAMHEGGICFIDEIGKIRPRALALLVSVLDERRYIDSTLLGERVHAKPSFRFIAATNTGEVNGLPEFIRSRMRPLIEVSYPPESEINMLAERLVRQEDDSAMILRSFWDLWNSAPHRPTPRDTIHHFALATSLAQSNRVKHKGNGHYQVRGPGAPPMLEPAHMQEAFKQLFETKVE